MKKLIFLLLLTFCVCTSCNKDNTVLLRFAVAPTNITDPVKWDSIAYTTINYCDMSELKTPEEINNPDLYSNTVNLDVRVESLTLTEGHTYVIKKFDMISKSGEILFYIPYEGQSGSSAQVEKLPLTIPINCSLTRFIAVIRFPS